MLLLYPFLRCLAVYLMPLRKLFIKYFDISFSVLYDIHQESTFPAKEPMGANIPGTHIWVGGKCFNLVLQDSRAHLLGFRKGRRALARWLDANKDHPIYAVVNDHFSSFCQKNMRVFERAIAAATLALSIAAPAASFAQSGMRPIAMGCEPCHQTPQKSSVPRPESALKKPVSKEGAALKKGIRKASLAAEPRKLKFFTTGSRGSGVTKVGTVHHLSGTAVGKVGTTGLLFRDARGERLLCGLGRSAPKGADVVLGTRAYTLWKNGKEWTMRNIVALNGIAVEGDVFIADSFIEQALDGRKESFDPEKKRPELNPVQAWKEEQSHAPGRAVKMPSSSPDARENTGMRDEVKVLGANTVQAVEEKPAPAQSAATQRAPLSSPLSADSRIREMVSSIAEDRIIVEQKGDRYEVTSFFGGLTVLHTFKGGSGMITIHEASLKAYPELSFMEVFNVPLTEVVKNIASYSRGVNGQMGKHIVLFVKRQLKPLFDNNRMRQLPPPDSRLLTGVRIVGDDEYFKQAYFSTTGGEWVSLDDELLVRILHSEPVTSYAEQITR